MKHVSYVYFTFTKFKVQITIKNEMASINTRKRDILTVVHFKRTDGREEKLHEMILFPKLELTNESAPNLALPASVAGQVVD